MKRNAYIGLVTLVLFLGVAGLVLREIAALPSGVAVSFQYNGSSNGTAAGSRNDSGGYIYVTNMDTLSQNQNWKAYLGNVTGSFTLDDAQNRTIYNWELTVTGGEVYASRNSTINWPGIVCANEAHMESENNYFGYSATQVDNINRSFNATVHTQIKVGAVTITANTCNSTFLFVNDTRQATATASDFQEVVLSDGGNMVFAALIENNAYGFDNTTYDFQMIVPENGSSTTTNAYYFYAEIK
ncbi:MAG: hypothetical protein ABIJ21_03825 [Nanoarchaeota archaeon]